MHLSNPSINIRSSSFFAQKAKRPKSDENVTPMSLEFPEESSGRLPLNVKAFRER